MGSHLRQWQWGIGVGGFMAAVVAGGCDKSHPPAAVPNPATAAVAATVIPATPVDPVKLYGRPSTRPGTIMAGDWVRLRVGDLINANSVTAVIQQVESDNTLSCPLAGPVVVGGLTGPEAEQVIRKLYEKAQIVSRAHISIEVICLAQPGQPAPGPVAINDLLRVGVSNLTSNGTMTTVIHRVAGDGTIDLPFVGRVKVLGMSCSAAERGISAAYQKAQVINNAMVMVTKLESAPPGGDHLDLPDGPIYPVPEALKPVFAE